MSDQRRVLTYSRVSTSQHQSTEAQAAELKRYCEARGWIIVREISDRGYSGGTNDRPGLKELFELVRKREVDVVVVTKLDRLFRSLRHLVTTLEDFDQIGVAFVATRDAIDWSTSAGRFFAQVLGSLAEFERSLIRERISAGLAHARAKGKVFGRPRSSMRGEIIRLRADGLSHRKIAAQLGASKGLIHRTLKEAALIPPQNCAPQAPEMKGDGSGEK